MSIQRGFTLIEILVVVAIIGVLSSIVTLTVVRRMSDARIEAAKSDIRTIENALTLYRMDNFGYPPEELGIRALVERPTRSEAPKWKDGGYLRKLPIDPWGNEYGYENNGANVDIFTLGADAKPGGEDEAADIHWSDI